MWAEKANHVKTHRKVPNNLNARRQGSNSYRVWREKSMTQEYDAWPKVDVLNMKELKRVKQPLVLLEKKI